VRDLEQSPGVDPAALAEALELMKLAKFAARPKQRRKRGTPRESSPYEEPAEVLARLQAAGVNLDRAPRAALQDVIDSFAPPRDFPELRPRGQRSKRNAAHRRMLERE
jgi:hypothetical protein